MYTEQLKPTQIAYAASLLKKGEVVAFPTETVYGLGACLFNSKAVLEIFRLKNRPSDNPLIAHISSLSQLDTIAVEVPPLFFKLAEAFFPGPLTVILKKHPQVPSIVSGKAASIAVRMPKHPIAQALITAVGEPLVAPSANLSGKPSATQCAHVLEDFDGHISAVIDGGKTELGIESTVISLLHNPPLLFRPGTITKAQIEEVIGEIAQYEETFPKEILSPGMKYRHYCPSTEIFSFYSIEELLLAAVAEKHPMVLTHYETLELPRGEHFQLTAKELYALFRYADAKGFSRILILLDAILMQDEALKNRLLRALS